METVVLNVDAAMVAVSMNAPSCGRVSYILETSGVNLSPCFCEPSAIRRSFATHSRHTIISKPTEMTSRRRSTGYRLHNPS